MSEAEASRFFLELEQSSELQSAVSSNPGKPELIYPLIVQKGFDCTIDELREAFIEYAASRLGEDQLDSLAAGLSKGDQIVLYTCPTLLGAGLAVGFAASAAAAI